MRGQRAVTGSETIFPEAQKYFNMLTTSIIIHKPHQRPVSGKSLVLLISPLQTVEERGPVAAPL